MPLSKVVNAPSFYLVCLGKKAPYNKFLHSELIKRKVQKDEKSKKMLMTVF